jgi:peptide/nickel transport system permease protein
MGEVLVASRLIDDFDTAKKQSAFRSIMKRLLHHPTGMIGCSIFLLMCLFAIFAPFITPYGYNDIDVMNAFLRPSWAHLCGTDELGRDLFTRLLYGARYSLALGIAAQLLSFVLGISLGCVAGYFGGGVDNGIMRFCDIWQSIPGQLLTVVLATVLGNGWGNTVLAMGIGGIPGCARMIRGQLLSVREKEFVEAAVATNCKGIRVIWKYMLPNAIQPMIVSTAMGIGGTIMGAAGLSYLGLGVRPPMAEWGAMLTAGRTYIRRYPHLIAFPGLFIAITVLALNMFGDGLRDAMDPRMKT